MLVFALINDYCNDNQFHLRRKHTKILNNSQTVAIYVIGNIENYFAHFCEIRDQTLHQQPKKRVSHEDAQPEVWKIRCEKATVVLDSERLIRFACLNEMLIWIFVCTSNIWHVIGLNTKVPSMHRLRLQKKPFFPHWNQSIAYAPTYRKTGNGKKRFASIARTLFYPYLFSQRFFC